MALEIIITAVLAALAIYIFYKSIKNSSKAKCSCGNCKSPCIKKSKQIH